MKCVSVYVNVILVFRCLNWLNSNLNRVMSLTVIDIYGCLLPRQFTLKLSAEKFKYHASLISAGRLSIEVH